MNPASVDIKDYLLTTEIDLTFATNLFIGMEPKKPNDCVTIFDTPGFGRDKFYDPTLQYHRPSIQVRVRNKSYTVGWGIINDITEILHNQRMVINGMYYSAMFCSMEPSLLDFDENERPRFVATFDLQRSTGEPVTWEHIDYKTWLDIIK